MGSPAPSVPKGIDAAGCPARLVGIVQMSLRYIVSGSSVFSPSRQAGVGDVGHINRSWLVYTASKSARTLVRTFWAVA